MSVLLDGGKAGIQPAAHQENRQALFKVLKSGENGNEVLKSPLTTEQLRKIKAAGKVAGASGAAGASAGNSSIFSPIIGKLNGKKVVIKLRQDKGNLSGSAKVGGPSDGMLTSLQ